MAEDLSEKVAQIAITTGISAQTEPEETLSSQYRDVPYQAFSSLVSANESQIMVKPDSDTQPENLCKVTVEAVAVSDTSCGGKTSHPSGIQESDLATAEVSKILQPLTDVNEFRLRLETVNKELHEKNNELEKARDELTRLSKEAAREKEVITLINTLQSQIKDLKTMLEEAGKSEPPKRESVTVKGDTITLHGSSKFGKLCNVVWKYFSEIHRIIPGLEEEKGSSEYRN